MFTLVGFSDAAEHTAFAAVDAIADPHVRVSVNDIYVPMWNKLMMVYPGGAGMTQCRMQSPSLRRLANQRVTPVFDNTLPAGGWTGDVLSDYHLNPRTLDIAEALNAFVYNTGNTREWILVWLMDKLEALPAGEIFAIEADTTITAVTAAWVNGALAFKQTLPAGRYAIVGMRVEDTACVAGRLVFPDIGPRPGCIGTYATSIRDLPIFRQGRLGSWGEFEHDAPPTFDLLSSADGAKTPEIIFDLIQVRAGRR